MRSPRLTRVCKICSKVFFTQNNIIKKGSGIFCSVNCFHKYRASVRKFFIKKCKICLKEFSVFLGKENKKIVHHFANWQILGHILRVVCFLLIAKKTKQAGIAEMEFLDIL